MFLSPLSSLEWIGACVNQHPLYLIIPAIPTTFFNMGLNAKLSGDDVDYSYILSSNLFQVKSSGNIIPNSS